MPEAYDPIGYSAEYASLDIVDRNAAITVDYATAARAASSDPAAEYADYAAREATVAAGMLPPPSTTPPKLLTTHPTPLTTPTASATSFSSTAPPAPSDTPPTLPCTPLAPLTTLPTLSPVIGFQGLPVQVTRSNARPVKYGHYPIDDPLLA